MSEFVEYVVPQWRGLEMHELKVDEAYLLPQSHYAQPTYLYSLSTECYECPFERLRKLSEGNEGHLEKSLVALRVNVAHALKFKLYDSDVGRYAFANESALCELDGSEMREFGVYNLSLYTNGSCSWATDMPGVNVNLSLLFALVLVALVLCVLKMSCCAWRTYRYDAEAAELANGSPTADQRQSIAPQRNRLRSLDAFRGLAIVLMIFVNSGGGHYWWIEHATWNGLHLADVVFPCFLWIMGVCLPISVRSQLVHGVGKWPICRRITWRSLKLFAIGLCLNSINGPQLEQLRLMGVLQRFAVAYFICGIAHTLWSQSSSAGPSTAAQNHWLLQDVHLLRWELLFAASLCVVHLCVIFALPVPGCPTGYLGPGGKHMNASFTGCIGGATGYVDTQILGTLHIYQHPTAKQVYNAGAFDPEGVFGCLLTAVQVLFGVAAGAIILEHQHDAHKRRLGRWLSCAMLCALFGAVLCNFSTEGGLIPVNKNLWSLSFVCLTSALAFALLSVLYWVIDVQRWWTGWPFVECGMNAIVMYVGHTVMHKMLPWHWRIGAMNTHFVLLLESIWNTLLWVGIALYLDGIKFYYSL